MPLQDANVDAVSSDASDLDDFELPATEVVDKPEPAASSPAIGETDADLLSVARDAIDKQRSAKDAAPPAAGEEQVLADGTPKKPDDEEYTDVPFNKHPRFQHLLRKAKTYEQDAGRYRNVENFLSNAGLDANEAADALSIAGLIKSNPIEAWKKMKPTVQKLLELSGELLPEDIRTRVQSGEMTHDVALEVSRARAARNSVDMERQFQTQVQQTRQQQEAVLALRQAADDWQVDRAAKDPNFADKREDLLREVLYLQATEGKPNTPEGVKAQLKKAYDAANNRFRPAAAPAQRPAVKPIVGGQVAGNQKPTADMTTLDRIAMLRTAR